MLNLYFGNYLLRQRLIDGDTLRKMLSIQRETKLRIGVLAMHEGLMTAEQVEEVVSLQRKVDAMFGELAVEKGYLAEETLYRLLRQQQYGAAKLTQLLLDHEVFDHWEMEEIIKGYQKENAMTEEEMEALHQADPEKLLSPYVQLYCQLADQKQTGELTAYGSLFLRNMIRFIDRQTLLEFENQQLPPGELMMVSQRFTGEVPMETMMLMEQHVFMNLAAIHAGMQMEGNHELAMDSVKEFFNLHNGLFAVWLSERSLNIDMRPPEMMPVKGEEIGEEWLKLPYFSELGRVLVLVRIE